MAAVDEDHAFLSKHDARIGIEIFAHVDIDPIFNLLDLRTEVLRLGDARNPNAKERRDNEPELQFHIRLLDGTIGREGTKKAPSMSTHSPGSFGYG
jgi:hypothetical protein